MVDDKKLDILLQRVYQDGMEKSKKESEEIVSQANEKAKNIIEEATQKSKLIIEEANKKAEEVKKNTETDVRMAGEQSVATLKQSMKDMISSDVLSAPMKDLFVDVSFLKELILEVVKKWDAKVLSSDVSLYFSDSMKSKIDDAFVSSVKKSAEKINVNFDGKMSGGFKIVSEANGYKLSFTDEDFVLLFGDFIKQKTEEVLFKK